MTKNGTNFHLKPSEQFYHVDQSDKEKPYGLRIPRQSPKHSLILERSFSEYGFILSTRHL